MQQILPIAPNGSDTPTDGSSEARRIDGLSERLSVVTRQRMEFHNVTSQVEAAVKASGVRSGIVTVRSMHTTATVFLNEWQEALLADYQRLFELLVPDGEYWRHNDPRYSDCERGNAVAHLRALLFGSLIPLPIRDGQLERGTWQSIIFAELDGPQTRSVGVEIRGDFFS